MPRGIGGLEKRGPKGPSKYTQKYIEELADLLIYYAQSCQDKMIPMFLERFGSINKVPAQTISLFTKKGSDYFNDKFSEAYRIFKEWQRADIIEGALSGRYDSSFAKFTMKNISEWRDEQHIKGEGIAPILQFFVSKDLPKNRLSEIHAL